MKFISAPTPLNSYDNILLHQLNRFLGFDKIPWTLKSKSLTTATVVASLKYIWHAAVYIFVCLYLRERVSLFLEMGFDSLFG